MKSSILVDQPHRLGQQSSDSRKEKWLCLDPRDLNKAIKCEYFKIPTMQEIASEFAGKTVFSTLDLKDDYWQVQLDEKAHCYAPQHAIRQV